MTRDLPLAAQRYLEHAIAPGTGASDEVRLEMHGEIKLGKWRPFRATEIIRWPDSMVWRARTSMSRLPVSGFDKVSDGRGIQHWKMLGFIPVLNASGPDIARSGAGRMAGESVWLPSVLADPATQWEPDSPARASARLDVLGEKAILHVAIAPTGALQSIVSRRWGNPGAGAFRYEDFGGVVEAENTFGGYTIPTRLRMGWYFGTDRFEPEGEFIRITIDKAVYT